MPGIVIEPRKLVYWPVPKCACTALKTAVAASLSLTYIGNVHAAPFTWTPDPIPGYENFAVVRHPATRLYSLWVNKIAAGHPIGARYVDGMDVDVFGRFMERFRNGMPFEAFVRTALEIPPTEADPHWAPQAGQVPTVATWCRLEDAEPLMRLLFPALNQSHYRMPWADAYQSTWSLITSYYVEDFARFGYVR